MRSIAPEDLMNFLITLLLLGFALFSQAIKALHFKIFYLMRTEPQPRGQEDFGLLDC